MGKIQFKATRRLHDSGYRLLDKSGDLKYDQDANSRDGVWLYIKGGGRVFVHCKKDGTYELMFDDDKFELEPSAGIGSDRDG